MAFTYVVARKRLQSTCVAQNVMRVACKLVGVQAAIRRDGVDVMVNFEVVGFWIV